MRVGGGAGQGGGRRAEFAQALGHARVRSGVLRRVVRYMGEVYAQHHGNLPAEAMGALLDAMEGLAEGAGAVNGDAELRRGLEIVQEAAGVRGDDGLR